MKRAAGLGILIIALLGLILIHGDRGPRRNLAGARTSVVQLDAPLAAFDTVRELTIDGDAEDMVWPRWMAVSRTGMIAFGQDEDHAVAIYGPDGARVAKVGRDGGGPGEFRDIGRMGWIGDTLWVDDPAQKRVAFFLSTGEFLGSERHYVAFAAPADLGRYPVFFEPSPMALPTTERMIVVGMVPPFVQRPQARCALFSINSLGMIERCVAQPPAPSRGVAAGVAGVSRPIPFGSPLVQSPDGRRLGHMVTHFDGTDGGTIDLTVLSDLGDTLVSRSYPFVGARIPRRVVDSVIDERAARLSAAEAAALRTHGPGLAPPFFPPVNRLMFGVDSTIWIGQPWDGKGWPWIILDWHGNPIGTVRLTAGLFPAAASREFIWAPYVARDEIPRILRYRIVAAGK
jgi:hypothetical protein